MKFRSLLTAAVAAAAALAAQPALAQKSADTLRAMWTDPGNFSVRAYYAVKLGNEDAVSAPDKSGRFWIQAIKYF